MANTDRTRKLLIRTALVTSTTIATLIGAQNFAMLDARDFQPTQTPDNTAAVPPVIEAPVTHNAPAITILQAAPSITILRQSGQATTLNVPANAASTTRIQPPAPSQIAAPQPVIVQQPMSQPAAAPQPVPQRSNSSR